MKIKGFWYDSLVIGITLACSVAFIGVTAMLGNKYLAIAEAAAAAAVIIVKLIRLQSARVRYKKFVISLTHRFDYTKESVLESFPFPSVVCDESGTIMWCNSRFFSEIAGSTMTDSTSIDLYSNSVGIDSIVHEDGVFVSVGSRYYCVRTNTYKRKGNTLHVLYYLDETMLKKTEKEYFLSRPYFLLIEADSVDDSRSDYRDSERAEIKSGIEALIENWAEQYSCVMKRLDGDRNLIIAKQSDFNKMVEDRFSILESVRNYEYKGKRVGASLSVGVSGGSTFEKCDKGSRNALEMALGRGGDQVAIKNKDEFSFIGGVSQSSERKNKVRVRVISSAISELIRTSDCVLVMGHKFTDLDSIGAGVGICCAAASVGVDCRIVTDASKSLADSLIRRLASQGMGNLVISEQEALERITKKTLLVVVDTHIQSFVEFSQVFDKVTTRVVIDHHRRSVGQIESAVVFHHDPTASSACEMVTELLQYLSPSPDVTAQVAEALLSGIMLDTKDFVIRAGVRTFEAAAFLRDKGADTINVKRLFSNSMEVNRLRTRVISNAKEYKGCAVSQADFTSPDIRIICAQAADELLNVTDIVASFVVFADGAKVNISARSLGDVNVQLIMESLGGGGHQTMAAAQLQNSTPEAALVALTQAIDKHFADYPRN